MYFISPPPYILRRKHSILITRSTFFCHQHLALCVRFLKPSLLVWSFDLLVDCFRPRFFLFLVDWPPANTKISKNRNNKKITLQSEHSAELNSTVWAQSGIEIEAVAARWRVAGSILARPVLFFLFVLCFFRPLAMNSIERLRTLVLHSDGYEPVYHSPPLRYRREMETYMKKGWDTESIYEDPGEIQFAWASSFVANGLDGLQVDFGATSSPTLRSWAPNHDRKNSIMYVPHCFPLFFDSTICWRSTVLQGEGGN